MAEFKKISFLNEKENLILRYLVEAQRMFDELSVEDPQHPMDSFNFGHYVDAAKNAVVLRGARRIDPVALMPKHESHTESIMPDMDDIINGKSARRIDINDSPEERD